MSSMQKVEGVVTLAQESRFQLVDDAGIAHLFMLSHAAGAEASHLADLQRRQSRVRVRYADASTVIAKVALGIEFCEPG